MPPWLRSRISLPLNNSRAKDSDSHSVPQMTRRRSGQAFTHSPQDRQPAFRYGSNVTGPGPGSPCIQAAAHLPQPVQDPVRTMSSGLNEIPSGLWHQLHRSGHPFRKTVFLMPGPSWTANSSISKTIPFDIRLHSYLLFHCLNHIIVNVIINRMTGIVNPRTSQPCRSRLRNRSATLPVRTLYRYFVVHTIWYSMSYTTWLLNFS